MIAVCTHCDNEFYVPVELGGRTVNCSKCKKQVKAPEKPSVSEVTIEPEGSTGTDAEPKPSGSASNVAEKKDNAPADTGVKTGSPTGPAERVQYVANTPKPKSPPKRKTKPAINPPSKSSFMGAKSSVSDIRLKGPGRAMNLKKGFNRLAIVVSILSAIAVGTVRYFYFRDTTVISAETPVEIALPWSIGAFALVWVVYLVGVFISRGFRGPWRILTGGWIRVALVSSVLPLVPSLIKCGQYLLREPSWRLKQVYEFFLWWPVYAFAGVWAAFWLGMFVASGFRHTEGAAKTVTKKEKKTKAVKPIVTEESPVAKKQTWRTS